MIWSPCCFRDSKNFTAMEANPLCTWFLKRCITSFGQFIFPWLPLHELAHKNKHCKQERRTSSYVLATCIIQYQLSFLKSHCCSLELFYGKPSFEKKYLLQVLMSVEYGRRRERGWRSKWQKYNQGCWIYKWKLT